jgi:hypothetical protein
MNSVIDVLLEPSHGYPLDWLRAVEAAERARMAPFEDLWRFDLGDCEHGYDVRGLIEDGDLTWWLNTYIVPPNLRREEAVYLLGGFHDLPLEWPRRAHPFDPGRPDFTYCIPWAWSPLGVMYRW